jgi:hypothetical protein
MTESILMARKPSKAGSLCIRRGLNENLTNEKGVLNHFFDDAPVHSGPIRFMTRGPALLISPNLRLRKVAPFHDI